MASKDDAVPLVSQDSFRHELFVTFTLLVIGTLFYGLHLFLVPITAQLTFKQQPRSRSNVTIFSLSLLIFVLTSADWASLVIHHVHLLRILPNFATDSLSLISLGSSSDVVWTSTLRTWAAHMITSIGNIALIARVLVFYPPINRPNKCIRMAGIICAILTCALSFSTCIVYTVVWRNSESTAPHGVVFPLEITSWTLSIVTNLFATVLVGVKVALNHFRSSNIMTSPSISDEESYSRGSTTGSSSPSLLPRDLIRALLETGIPLLAAQIVLMVCTAIMASESTSSAALVQMSLSFSALYPSLLLIVIIPNDTPIASSPDILSQIPRRRGKCHTTNGSSGNNSSELIPAHDLVRQSVLTQLTWWGGGSLSFQEDLGGGGVTADSVRFAPSTASSRTSRPASASPPATSAAAVVAPSFHIEKDLGIDIENAVEENGHRRSWLEDLGAYNEHGDDDDDESWEKTSCGSSLASTTFGRGGGGGG